jgi:ADP-heptose:LPS heptosyltransferase
LQPPTGDFNAAAKADRQRLLDYYIGVPLCALLSLIARLRGRREPVVQPRRILVILLSEMGSMVCTQPMFHELAQRYPSADIYLLILARNREVVDLLQLVPPERIFTVPDDSLFSFIGGALAAIRRLRRLRLDIVIDCELFARVSAIFAFLSAARLHVGFHRHTLEGLFRGSFIDRPVLYNAYAHIATQFLSLVGAIESTTAPPGKENPLRTRPVLKPLRFSDHEHTAASERLYRDFPSLQGHPLVLIYAGSGPLPVRAWPIEHFVELARSFIEKGCAVAVIGLPADKPLGTAIVEECKSVRCIDITGYTPKLRDLLLIFHQADLLVTNDGGPNHFAALTPVPIVSLFGPETPVLYAPLAERAVTLYRHLPCSPCLSAYNHRRTPCDGDNQCLRQISVSEALRAAQRLMAVPVTA